jgi:hypothetical protein
MIYSAELRQFSAKRSETTLKEPAGILAGISFLSVYLRVQSKMGTVTLGGGGLAVWRPDN